MFRPIEASVLCNNLSVVATYERTNSTLSSTCLPSIGRGRKPGEPGRSSPDIPKHTTSRDPGAGAASPGAACPGMPKLTPHITKSHSEPQVSSLGWGPTPSKSMLAVPSDAPPAPDISSTGASHNSGEGSSGVEVSHGATTGHGEPGGWGS
jgi:hypothetical protein